MIRLIQTYIFFTLAICYGQINVGNINKDNDIEITGSQVLKQVKNGILIIVKPAYLDQGKLKDIAEKVWSLGMVKVVDYKEFDPLDFVSKEFAVCRIYPFISVSNNNLGLTTYLVNNQLDFYTVDEDKLKIEYNKVRQKKQILF